MNRRGRGEGSIYFDRERSKWVGVLNLTEPGGKRVRRKVSAPTKTVAREKLAALRKELEDVSLAAPRVTTVAAVVADWLDNLPRGIKDWAACSWSAATVPGSPESWQDPGTQA